MSDEQPIEGVEFITSIQELEVIHAQLNYINELIKMPDNEDTSPYSKFQEHRIKMIESCYKVIIEANQSIISWLKED